MGPFKVIYVIAENAIKIDLPSNIKIHPVVQVYHTARVCRNNPEFTCPADEQVRSHIDDFGKTVIEVQKILASRKHGGCW